MWWAHLDKNGVVTHVEEIEDISTMRTAEYAEECVECTESVAVGSGYHNGTFHSRPDGENLIFKDGEWILDKERLKAEVDAKIVDLLTRSDKWDNVSFRQRHPEDVPLWDAWRNGLRDMNNNDPEGYYINPVFADPPGQLD